MTVCSKLKKRKCSVSCQWIRRKGCRNICPQGSELNVITDRCKRKSGYKSKSSSDTKPVNVRLIDSGSYGCVITPPISGNKYLLEKYIEYKDRNKDDVGKLFIRGKKTFTEELNILKKIQDIDPHGMFTVKLKGASKINKISLKNSRNVISCLNGEKNNYFQIILENGGVECRESPNISYNKFLKMFHQFIKGMVILQNNNMVHGDIKPNNVLVSNNKISLIDFGLSVYSNKVYIKNNISTLLHKYKYYPPEFMIAGFMIYNSKILDQNNEKFMETLNDIESISEKYGLFRQSYLYKNDSMAQKYRQGLREFAETIKLKGFKKVKQIFTTKLALKVDVFSLAFIISSLNKRIIYTSDRQKQFVTFIHDRCFKVNPFERISMVNLYNIVSKELEHIKNKKVVGGYDDVKSSHIDDISDSENYPTPQK